MLLGEIGLPEKHVRASSLTIRSWEKSRFITPTYAFRSGGSRMHAYLTGASQFCAIGADEGPELNRATRISNAWEMAKLVRNSLAQGGHVICVRFTLFSILVLFC